MNKILEIISLLLFIILIFASFIVIFIITIFKSILNRIYKRCEMKQIHKYILIFSIYCILIILYAILTTNNHILYGDICIWSAVGTIIYLSCLSGENESIKDLLKRYPKPIKSCKLEGT